MSSRALESHGLRLAAIGTQILRIELTQTLSSRRASWHGA
jgi:hypothetical protein